MAALDVRTLCEPRARVTRTMRRCDTDSQDDVFLDFKD